MKNMLSVLMLLSFALSKDLNAQPQDVLEVEALSEMTKNIEDTSSKLIEISSPLVLARKNIKGIYLDSEWAPAIVYSMDKEFLNCTAKYNIYKNRMEIKIDDAYRALNKQQIKGVIIGDTPYVTVASAETEDGNLLGYYEVLADGNLSLLKKYKLSLHNTGGTALHPTLGTEKEYRSSHELYYCFGGQKAHKLQKGKKNITGLFGGQKASMLDFADKNGLGFRKDKDLIKLFDYFNEINN